MPHMPLGAHGVAISTIFNVDFFKQIQQIQIQTDHTHIMSDFWHYETFGGIRGFIGTIPVKIHITNNGWYENM